PAPRTEDRRQTDDARRVSRSVAAVDVVRPEHDTGELLREEVHFVRGLRAAEGSERVRAARLDVPPESIRGAVECLVPRGGAKHAVVAHERRGQAGIQAGLRAIAGHTVLLLAR